MGPSNILPFRVSLLSYRLVVGIVTVKIKISTLESHRYRMCVFTELRVVIT